MCPDCPTCDLLFPFAELETAKEKDKLAAVKKGTVFGTMTTIISHYHSLDRFIMQES